MQPKDPWFPIALMLVVLIPVWLGLAGPLLDDAAARGVLHVLNRWQTLFTAGVAGLAAFIAWKNVSRQLRLSAISREEERLQRELPGLRETARFLKRLHQELVNQTPEARVTAIRKRIPGDIAQALPTLLPNTDTALREQIAPLINSIGLVSQQIIAKRAVAYLDKDGDARKASDIAAVQAMGELLVGSLTKLVKQVTGRQKESEGRLTKMRAEIAAVIERS